MTNTNFKKRERECMRGERERGGEGIERYGWCVRERGREGGREACVTVQR
jgi:hypothetical protein